MLNTQFPRHFVILILFNCSFIILLISPKFLLGQIRDPNLRGCSIETLEKLFKAVTDSAIKQHGDTVALNQGYNRAFLFSDADHKYIIEELHNSDLSMSVFPLKVHVKDYIKTVAVDSTGYINWAYTQKCDACDFENQIDVKRGIVNSENSYIIIYKELIEKICRHFNVRYQ